MTRCALARCSLHLWVSATVTPNPTSQNPECVQWEFWFSGWWTFHFSSADRISKLSKQSHTLSSGLNKMSYLFIHFSVYSLHSSSWWTCLKIPWPLCRIQEMKGINSQRSQIFILMITGNVNLVKKVCFIYMKHGKTSQISFKTSLVPVVRDKIHYSSACFKCLELYFIH